MNKINRNHILMLSSLILMGVFTLMWLNAAYNNVKTELQKELFGEFMFAKERVIDSSLAKNLINPILENSEGFIISNTDDSLHINDTIQIVQTIPQNDSAFLKIEKQFITQQSENIAFEYTRDTQNIMIKGVRMFISKLQDPNHEMAYLDNMIHVNDTSILKKYFAENIAQKKINVQVEWVKNSPIGTFPPPPFYFDAHLFDIPFGAQIIQYKNQIYKEILPQIIFSIVLIAFTLYAFYFTNKNMMRQIQLNKLKDDLVSNISHELKTPVATIKVAIEAILQMDPIEKKDKIKSYLGMASEEVHRLEILVNQIMQSVLYENGNQILHPAKLMLPEIIVEVFQSLQLRIKEHKIQFTFEQQENDLEVFFDPLQLKGIFFNLFDNAIKYAGNGSQIEIRLTQRKEFVWVEFMDNGPGIPKEFQSNIFQKFFRVPTNNLHQIKGYGLGLYYISKIITQSGGEINLDTSHTPGCKFNFKLPMYSL